MSRLTIKTGNHYFHPEWIDEIKSNNCRGLAIGIIDKLGKYEDIEGEINCPLEAMVAAFKAIQQGFIYVDLGNGLYREDNVILDYGDISEDEEGYIGCSKSTNYHYILDCDGCVFVEDYKKTWWLKEDRSE